MSLSNWIIVVGVFALFIAFALDKLVKRVNRLEDKVENLRFPNGRNPEMEEIALLGGLYQEEDDRLQRVKEYLRENKEITNSQHRELTGISEAQATRDFDKLEKQGIVEQIGKTGKYVKYRLKD